MNIVHDEEIKCSVKRKLPDINFRPKKKHVVIEYTPTTIKPNSDIVISRPHIVELYDAKNVSNYTILDNYAKKILHPSVGINSEKNCFTNLKIAERQCYICRQSIKSIHWFYLYQCQKCGDNSLCYRYATRDLSGRNALVIGGRIKLGYQIALKLLRAGCRVMITSRNIDTALEYYQQEPDYLEWKSKLFVFSESFDLGKVKETIPNLITELNKIFGENQLDILIQNAAQTIYFDNNNDNNDNNDNSDNSDNNDNNDNNDPINEMKEKEILDLVLKRGRRLTYPPVEWRVTFAERYGRKLDYRSSNTWGQNIFKTSDDEIISVVQNNIIGSVLIDKYLIPIMRPDKDTYVIHVHAKEGTLDTHKTMNHMHTNIAKAGLHMLTRCLAGNSDSDEPRPLYPQIHGVNPGWFSIDEYPVRARFRSKIFNPPIDEIDAASRVVHPIFYQLPSSHKTWVHYQKSSRY
ncbi:short-chain dehydrogenase-reductase [Megavirus chiliensis]|uniref:Oxidoreductase n=2 Tax=Megamimivirinae TaxID=3044648 RepID=A0A2L2DNQ7_MIMIV|nr:putative oxidoreductase [Megavirus chiliensis]AEQ32706.1 short-chain dehydrogenase-reductase [Megavirus chiliensis]AVG47747.1 oxidoreductase [Acanthamoeba polyphaga mimivirus]